MRMRITNLILLFLLLADAGYSFYQHYNYPLDGDMPGIIVPSDGYAQIWKDPLGFGKIANNKVTASPNRFFAHFTMAEYFRHVPGMLHFFVNPITSVYLSIAIAKTLMQEFIICLIAAFITNTAKIFRKNFLLAAVIITPLIQTNQNTGFTRTMGIIDPAPTYAFFYALPTALLISFFYFFYKLELSEGTFKFNIGHKAYLLFLILFLPLNGPLGPGISLLVCPAILLFKWSNNFKNLQNTPFIQRIVLSIKKIPGIYLFYFLIFSVLCLYSLYIGRNDYENQNAIPLLERYKRLPLGLFNILTQQTGLPLLIALTAVNLVIIYRSSPSSEGRLILTFLKFIGIFGLIYLLLLPLGGYRFYRQNIIRYDTFMPITLCLIFLYGLTTCFLLKMLKAKSRVAFIVTLVVASLFFTLADKPVPKYVCERNAMQQIAKSPEKTVLLDCDCTLLSWGKMDNYENSRLNGQLLLRLGIIKELKLYYQK